MVLGLMVLMFKPVSETNLDNVTDVTDVTDVTESVRYDKDSFIHFVHNFNMRYKE